MERVEAEPGRMRLLVDERALLARIDQGRPLDIAMVDLATLAMDVVEAPAGTAVHVSIFQDRVGDSARAVQVLQVSDEGPGIPFDDLQHVFERFWRGDHSSSRNTGGSGLGLAIVQSIVQAHGGTIEISSRQPSGTCVLVRVPTHDPNGDQ